MSIALKTGEARDMCLEDTSICMCASFAGDLRFLNGGQWDEGGENTCDNKAPLTIMEVLTTMMHGAF